MAELSWLDVPAEVCRLVKSAELPVLPQLADVTGWKEGPINALWGGPRPLANTLAGAALGAGAGYGLGWLGEHLLPDYLENKRLRKTLGALGGLVGAVPGGLTAVDSLTRGHSVLEPWPPPIEKTSYYLDTALDETEARITACGSRVKEAQFGQANLMAPTIDKDGLGRLIMTDPMIPQPAAAAAGGLLEAASLARGGSALVSPFDVTRIAMGMGSGLVSGVLVGKTLGALAGLSPDAQSALRKGGVVAGLVKAIVPMVFGG